MAFWFPSLLCSCIHLVAVVLPFIWQLQVSFLPHSSLFATMLLLLSLFAATQETNSSQAFTSRPSNLFILVSIHFLLLNNNFLLLCWAFVFIALQHSIIFLFSLVSNTLISTVFITSSLLALLALALILCCSSSWFLDTGFLGSGSGGRGRGRQFFDLVFDGAEGGCFAQGDSCYLIILSVIHNQEDLKTVSKELRSQQGEQKNPRAGRKDDKTYAIQQ